MHHSHPHCQSLALSKNGCPFKWFHVKMGADRGCWGPAGSSLTGSACGQGSPCRQWPRHTGSGTAARRSQAVPVLKGKQRCGGQPRLDQGEGQPFSWLVDQGLLREFISGHFAVVLQGRQGSCGPPPIASGSPRWSGDHVAAWGHTQAGSG